MNKIILLLFLSGISSFSFSQKKEDSLLIKNGATISATPLKKDTLAQLHGRSPRKAALYSAVLPGLGQIYNHKYWKLPIVYGALGATGAIFFYNLKEYRKIQFAYTTLINGDSANFSKVAPELQPFIINNDAGSLRLNRNTFRRNIDYSVLFFILFWGLNVVDATVDAHLSSFNVSNDLSLKIKPSLQPNMAGVTLVLAFK
jgi:hypothetical protein